MANTIDPRVAWRWTPVEFEVHGTADPAVAPVMPADVAVRRPAGQDSSRMIRLAAAVSLALHVGLLFAGPIEGAPTTGFGDDETVPLGVAIISEAELATLGSVATNAAPPAPDPAPVDPVADEPQVAPTETASAVPQPETAPAAEPDPDVAARDVETAETETAAVTPPAEKPVETPIQVAATPKPEAPEQPAKLEPAIQSAATAPTAPTEAIVRPGRGTLDRYARDVRVAIGRALPGHAGRAGTVEIRFALSQSGDLDFAEVLNASVDEQARGRVLAAIRQARFPAPPRGATAADRVFSIAFEFR